MGFLDTSLSLATLVLLEVVLGIDNLIILSILTEKLPPNRRKSARRWGLTFAWMTRLLLLASAFFMVHLTEPIVTVADVTLSIRDLFLIFGGMFLIWKSTDEIHEDVSSAGQTKQKKPLPAAKSFATFKLVIVQIALLDIIFSLDSVLTAVGLTTQFWIMALAISCAILIMIFASESVSRFINKHPSLKMLALSYLILIGMVLIADGLSFHVPRGYLYFSMGFSLAVEALNLLRNSRKRR